MRDKLSFKTTAPIDRQTIWRTICETYIKHYIEQDDDFLTYTDFLEPFSDETLNPLLPSLLASYFSEHKMGQTIYEQIVSGLSLPDYQIKRVTHWFDDSVVSLFDILERTSQNNWLLHNHLNAKEYLVNHRTLRGLDTYSSEQLDQLFYVTLVREKTHYYALENTITLGEKEERLIFSLLNHKENVWHQDFTKQQQLFFYIAFTHDFYLENKQLNMDAFIDAAIHKQETMLILENEFIHYNSPEQQHVARHLLGEVFLHMTSAPELQNAQITSVAAALTYLLQQEPFNFGTPETQNTIAQRYNISISTMRKWYRYLKTELTPFIDSYH